jgi:nicotinate-nucleotide pyrophosphorylase
MTDPSRLRLLFDNHLGHVAHIQVVNSMTDQQGRLVVSPECRTLSELEHAADRIRGDLDRIVKAAEKKFKAPQPPLYTDD